jgi:hypothetical protein
MAEPGKRHRFLLMGGLMAAAVGAPAGWVISDRMEQDNDFCNSCHLDASTALHEDLRREFDAHPPQALASVHAEALVEGRDDPAFRCIDCHGGTGALGRLRVKVLAGKDAFWYAVGRFEEPDGMRWPLWDDDCRKCHAEFAGQDWDGRGSEPFHARSVHNAELGVACVECHAVHGPGGNPDGYFLHGGPVRSQCARCHPEFEQENP